jgi:Cu2+-exporting ATPase
MSSKIKKQIKKQNGQGFKKVSSLKSQDPAFKKIKPVKQAEPVVKTSNGKRSSPNTSLSEVKLNKLPKAKDSLKLKPRLPPPLKGELLPRGFHTKGVHTKNVHTKNVQTKSVQTKSVQTKSVQTKGAHTTGARTTWSLDPAKWQLGILLAKSPKLKSIGLKSLGIKSAALLGSQTHSKKKADQMVKQNPKPVIAQAPDYNIDALSEEAINYLPQPTVQQGAEKSKEKGFNLYKLFANNKKREPVSKDFFILHDYKKRFYFSLIITCSLLLFSPVIQEIFQFSLPASFYPYFLWLLSSLVFFYGGWPFFKGLGQELVQKSPGRMTLFVLSITLLYAYNTSVILGLSDYLFFGELILLIMIALISCWLEQKLLSASFSNAEEISSLMPDKAHKELDQIYKGIYEDVPLNQVHKHDILFVKPGERIPADSVIISGESSIDESKFTGDVRWVHKKKGDKLLGGSLNGEGALRLTVENTREDSYLFKIVKLLKQVQQNKTGLQRLTEQALLGITIMSISVGFITFVSWLLKGEDLRFAFERLVTSLIITCPPALGLGILVINAFFTNLFAQKGLFVCRYTAYEKATRVSSILFDKTGTLTKGKYEVIYAHGVNKRHNEKSVLKWAATLEQKSQHPIAQAIRIKAEELNIKIQKVDDFEQLTGEGVQGVVNGQVFKVVGVNYLREHRIKEPEGLKMKSNLTRVFLVRNETVIGVIGLEDNIREEAFPAIRHLQRNGIKCWLITGDSRETANNVAEDLCMDGFYAELSPAEKEAKVAELQTKGECVAMIGDSLKDSAALAKADLGLAVGVKNDIATEKADIYLINPNPGEIANFLLLSKAISHKIRRNLSALFIYSVCALLLATGILAGIGLLISPVVAALLAAISSLIIILNISMLKKFKLSKITT